MVRHLPSHFGEGNNERHPGAASEPVAKPQFLNIFNVSQN